MDNTNKVNRNILITKSSGEEQLFSNEKLIRSLRNAGAEDSTINQIVSNVEHWIYPGVTTKNIYGRAHAMLHKLESSSFRYRLKQAILELGPTGYPFEFLMGEIYKRQGWQVEVGQVLQGASITHEMDVIATKGEEQHLIECKYHKDQGKQVSIQVPLYVRARVNDIIELRETQSDYDGLNFVAGVSTNTRFSDDSTRYGEHAGIKLLSWDYPADNGIKDLIERYHIYPITILKDLTLREKQYLLNHKVVLCDQLCHDHAILLELGMTARKLKAVLKELGQICKEYNC
ncbi:MAG: hypothetical protein PF444_06700 [Bacteroidales bacterium]|jgi:hypothetical protein|nr:hypothetical protein [Bacteroidales bacterium]